MKEAIENSILHINEVILKSSKRTEVFDSRDEDSYLMKLSQAVSNLAHAYAVIGSSGKD